MFTLNVDCRRFTMRYLVGRGGVGAEAERAIAFTHQAQRAKTAEIKNETEQVVGRLRSFETNYAGRLST